jgi:ATP/maltotriose-dependent transcriptional regulator MalT
VPSGRERDVLGTELVISLATGKRHVRHIPARLDLRDRPRAIVLAHECGLVPDRAPR